MKRTVSVIGLIIGTILSANTIVMMNRMYTDPDFKGNDILGYAAMVALFSLIFVGVRNYRNKHLDGFISFGNAFKIGAWIAFVASTIYVILGLSYYYLMVPDFIEVYVQYILKHTPPAELQARTAEMENFKEMYKNPLFAILISYFEVLPVGLLVALVSAWIVKKKSN
ncbi:MAG: DUF4199 domain-containing protein [Cyclobacteriaceae bacterium]|nr:DUF4199 domain-containing protein [Cyclobacteriaceae bacterium]